MGGEFLFVLLGLGVVAGLPASLWAAARSRRLGFPRWLVGLGAFALCVLMPPALFFGIGAILKASQPSPGVQRVGIGALRSNISFDTDTAAAAHAARVLVPAAPVNSDVRQQYE